LKQSRSYTVLNILSYQFVIMADKSYVECVGRWLDIATFCTTDIFVPCSSSV